MLASSTAVPAQWMYGFVGTVATHNPFLPIAIQAIVFLGLSWRFFHRDDPAPLDEHFHLTHPAVLWMGAAVGALYVGFFRTPRFVFTRLFNNNGDFYPWFFMLIISAALTVTGVYSIGADFPALGWSLTVIFGIVTLMILVAYLFNFSSITDGAAQLKWMGLFVLTLLTEAGNAAPLVADGGINGDQSIRPWNAVIWAGVFLAVLVIFYAVAVLAPLPRQERNWWFDKRGHTSKRVFTLTFFLALAIVFIPSLIADEAGFQQFGPPSEASPAEEGTKTWYVFWAVFAGTLLILILMGVWYWLEGFESHSLSSGWDAGAGRAYKHMKKPKKTKDDQEQEQEQELVP